MRRTVHRNINSTSIRRILNFFKKIGKIQASVTLLKINKIQERISKLKIFIFERPIFFEFENLIIFTYRKLRAGQNKKFSYFIDLSRVQSLQKFSTF